MPIQHEYEVAADELETLANKLDSLDLTDSGRAILTTLFGGVRNARDQFERGGLNRSAQEVRQVSPMAS
jgi:hypothetical protein